MKEKRKKIANIVLAVFAVCLLSVLVYSIITVTGKQEEDEKEVIDKSAALEIENRENQNRDNARLQIVINEIFNGNDVAWVELFNPSNYDVEISYYSLKNSTENQSVSVPANSVIEAGGYYIIDNPPGDIVSGTTFVLVTEKEENIDLVTIPELAKEESYGRQSDGAMSFQYMTPTKRIDNSYSKLIAKSYPVFSVPSGFYADEFQLEMTIAEGYQIRYTLDGSTPNTDSQIYDTPIIIRNAGLNNNVLSARADYSISSSAVPANKIDKATVVRAVSFDSDGNSVQETTATYFIGYNAKAAYRDIPIVSIFADESVFTDYWEGMLVTGRTYDEARVSGSDTYLVGNYWLDIVQPVHVQFFEKDRTLSYDGIVDMSTYNDICLNPIQKSIELDGIELAEESNSSLQEFVSDCSTKSVILDAGRNDIILKMRNPLIQNLMKGRNVLTVDNQLCAMFLNGEFWGVYNIQQKIDEDYVASVYGLNPSDIIIAKNCYAVSGKEEDQAMISEFLQFFSETDLSDDQNYVMAEALFDMDSLMDCYGSLLYTANSEWPKCDIYMWRTRTVSSTGYNDGKWRFILAETDNSLALGTVNGYRLNSFHAKGLNDDILYSSLMTNEVFRRKFYIVLKDLEENVFNPDRVQTYLDTLYQQYKLPVIESAERFYNSSFSESVRNNAESITTFFENRQEYFDVYLDEIFTANVGGK